MRCPSPLKAKLSPGIAPGGTNYGSATAVQTASKTAFESK